MKRVIFRALIYAGLFYLLVLALRGLAFLLAHVPAASALDNILLAIVWVEGVLAAPKRFLRMLWPTQSTPGFVNPAITILNCFLWGMALAVLHLLLRKRSS